MRFFSAAISAFVFLQAQILKGTSFFSLFLTYAFNSSAFSPTVRSQAVLYAFYRPIYMVSYDKASFGERKVFKAFSCGLSGYFELAAG